MASKAQRKPLPLKEQALFKELLTLYESRTLKRALKTADQILKKVPDHGETMCMKGLVLTHMNRKEEGLELVKKGLVYDMQSHICWHVLGIIKKADKNWDEALKAYTQAVRFDKENMNLLRDAAQLQVHLRLFESLKETRWQILKLRPNLRQNWVGYAVACHLNGDLEETKSVLKTYFSTLKNIPDYDVEHSEVLLYYLQVLEEMGEHSDALSQLDLYAKERSIVDRTAVAESRARLLTKLSRKEDAAHAWRTLIDQNPECHDYYRGFLVTQRVDLNALTDETRVTALLFFKEIIAQLPKAMAAQRLALKIAKGDEFRELIQPYLTNGLVKGIPSLFVDVRALYVDEDKRKIIEQIMETFRGKSEKGENISGPFDPTVHIWILYFLALHYSARPLSPDAPSRDLARSLELLEQAIKHTPTLPELFMGKARVLKRAGDPFGAARAMEEARALDGQDRFLNWKAAKYLMRAGDIDGAIRLLGLFTKKDAPSPGSDLEDMQCLAYMLEEGDAHARRGRLGLALRRYKSVQVTFDDVDNDQFDFHNYSLRRFAVNMYLSLLSFEKQLRSHPAYIAAALASSKIYVSLHDDASLAVSNPAGKLSESDKKAKKKAKKAAQKLQEENKKPVVTAAGKDEDIPEPPKDDDPEGKKLLTTPDPLGDAMKWLRPLEMLAKDRVDVWVAIYDVNIRRRKFAQALKALNSARKLDPQHPEVHVRVIDYHLGLFLSSEPPATPLSVLLTSSLETLIPPGLSLETFNNEYIQRQTSSAEARLAGARVAFMLETPLETVESLVFETLSPEVKVTIQTSSNALEFLTMVKSARFDEFRIQASRRFPLSNVFKTEDEQTLLRKTLRPESTVVNGESGCKETEVAVVECIS
ncbi:NMDA receptor-regulated protein 1-domain-containing protein [Hysterangium stoloniferum]|nr:NMDA receptor-regulated protein 1-domain-containing protein [Hysterangium stoloniferum]